MIKDHNWDKINGSNNYYWNYYRCSRCNLHRATGRDYFYNLFKFKESDVYDIIDHIPTCNENMMQEALL